MEDEAELVAEAFSVLLQAVEAGTLASELAGAVEPALAEEVQATIVDFLRCGLRAETLEFEHGARFGLDRLFARFIETRDVPPSVPAVRRPDLSKLGDLADELSGFAPGPRGSKRGSRFIARLSSTCSHSAARRIRPRPSGTRSSRGGQSFRKRDDFPGDDAAWTAWKAFNGDDNAHPVRATALRDDLLRPLHRWMGGGWPAPHRSWSRCTSG